MSLLARSLYIALQPFDMRNENIYIYSIINSKNEATLSFYVHIDKMTQLNYIVDSNTEYLNNMMLHLKALNYNKI